MASSMRGGGSERQVLLLAKHLDRSRFEPHVYLTHREGSFLDQVPDDVTIHSPANQEKPPGIYIPGRQLRRQAAGVKDLVQRFSIDVVYDRTFHMTLLASNVPGSVRRVSTIVSPPHLAVPFVEKRFVGLKRWRLASAYRRSHCVIAVSQAAADSAASYYGLPPQSIQVVRNGVDAKGLREQADQQARKLKDQPLAEEQGRDTHRLLCVGRMTEEKGHADLLQAMACMLDQKPELRLKLRLVGDGILRQSLEEQTRTLNLSRMIEFAGHQDSIAGEIKNADALILPSRFEGLPNVVLEAMAIGTPVIATRAGGTPELQRDRPTAFWAEPMDPPSLSHAIQCYLESPSLAQQHAEAARDLIESDHDLKNSIHQIESHLT